MRDTRLLNKESFDDPNEFLEAGSSVEADMLAEWDRWELVEKIQEQDQRLYELEQKSKELVEALKYYANDADFITKDKDYEKGLRVGTVAKKVLKKWESE